MFKRHVTGLALCCCGLLAADSPLWGEGKENVWDPNVVRQTGQASAVFPSPSKIYDFAVRDFDRDGEDEVAAIRSGNDYPFAIYIKEILSDNYTYSPLPIRIHNKSLSLFPLDPHPFYRFLTYRIAADSAFFDLYNYRLQRMDSLSTLLGHDQTGTGYWNGSLVHVHMVDLNHDGKEDLLALFNTASDGQPRALLGYDLQSKKKILDIRMAPMAIKSCVVDLQKDGHPEILIAMAGASDGPFFGPFSRDSSYLALFDTQGELLFKKAFGSVSSYVDFAVGDMDGDQITDIVATSSHMVNENRQNARLVVLDGKDLAEKASIDGPLPVYFILPKLCDTNQDRCAELYVSVSSDRLHRYELRTDEPGLALASATVVKDSPRVEQFNDLDGDGIPELLVSSRQPRRLWFVNNNLVPLAYVQLAGQDEIFRLANTSYSTRNEWRYLLIDEQNLLQIKVPFKHLWPDPDIQLRWQEDTVTLSWRRGIVYVVLLTSAVAVLVLGLFYRANKRRPLPVPDSRRVGMAYFDASHRLAFHNSHFVHLLGGSDIEMQKLSFQELFSQGGWKALLDAMNGFLQHEHKPFRQVITLGSLINPKNLDLEIVRIGRDWTILLLTDLSESSQLERIRWWAAMAQRMAHKIKTPLATVLLAIQRMQRTYRKSAPELAVGLDAITTSAMSEIERVRDIINTFMKFAKLDEPVFVTADFTRVVQDALNEYFKRIPEGVEVKTSFEAEEMPVRIDIKQFEEALYNILDNAVSAIKAEGLVMLSTHFEKHPLNAWGSLNHAILEISDSGGGIGEEHLGHIFEPGYTTRSDGSGMGLIFARNIIESHLGELVVSSHQGMGTTVEIRLPLINKTGISSEPANARIDR